MTFLNVLFFVSLLEFLDFVIWRIGPLDINESNLIITKFY